MNNEIRTSDLINRYTFASDELSHQIRKGEGNETNIRIARVELEAVLVELRAVVLAGFDAERTATQWAQVFEG